MSSDTDDRSSPDVEQHAHPFCSSTMPAGRAGLVSPILFVPSDVALCPRTSLESMLTLATSFTMTAIFNPSLLFSICCNNVVFPDPIVFKFHTPTSKRQSNEHQTHYTM